ncbi:MAG: anion permease [Saprospiraceae bacterium]|nr:anion permease [Saprospiraceae bacterium]
MFKKIWDNIWFRRLLVFLSALLLWHGDIPWGIDPKAWQLFVLFIAAILSVLIDAFSIFVAALLAMTLAVLFQVLDTTKAFSGFSESFMLLILSSFLISNGVVKSGLGKRLALLLIKKFGHSTLRLGYCVIATDALIGPGVPSNTARSGVLYPIVRALALDTGSQPEPESRKTTGSYLMMLGMVSLSLSSSLWLTAMAANPISAGFGAQFGVNMDFGRWILVSSVPTLLGMLLLPYILYRTFPPAQRNTPEAPLAAAEALREMGPLSKRETAMAIIFTVMIIFWALANALNLNLAIITFLGLAAMIIFNVMSIQELQEGGGEALVTFLWFAIMYVLSSALNEMGFMKVIGEKISGQLVGFSWPVVYVVLIVLYVFIHYLFVSQTAHLLALFGVFLEVGNNAGVPVVLMVYMLAFATNFFSALTPQASSANVLFAGSGYLQQQEVYKQGFLVTVACLIIYMLCSPWILAVG